MRIVFMGTPEFARRPLGCLCQSQHELLAVVTGTDKKAGRGQKYMPTPCRQEAQEHQIPVFTPVSLKDEQFYEDMKALDPDLFVVTAFQILPKKLYELLKNVFIAVIIREGCKHRRTADR